MVTFKISTDQDTIEGELHIAAPAERVFRALTDPRQLLQWWGQKGIYHGIDWKTDVRPGGQWRCQGVSDIDGASYHVEGEYVEVDPPRVLSYTWVKSWSGPPLKTLVRWELEPVSGGTLVRLRHSGFARAPEAAQDHHRGWQRVVRWLREFVEKGETMATRPGISPAPQG
jgi:uncharacterized protein YndB with AHSA1/START domain